MKRKVGAADPEKGGGPDDKGEYPSGQCER
jgi:hypothetical protein